MAETRHLRRESRTVARPVAPSRGGATSRGGAASPPLRPDRLRNVSAPIVDDKDLGAPSAFTPEGLLSQARRQKGLAGCVVPGVCVLDPDGDIVRDLIRSGRARRDPDWACYHTELYLIDDERGRFGIIGGAIGGSYAVLIAEELFASGCVALVSVTSAGQIAPMGSPPYFVLIDRALRDEGTSYHYLAPARYADADPALIDEVEASLRAADLVIERGRTWTTDAPFRETIAAISARRAEGIVAVEMEAAALYAFGQARGRAVVCFAQVTNQMGQAELDFEKGDASGASAAIRVIEALVPVLGRR